MAYILTISCADRTGIVAAVAGTLASIDGFILDSQQYADPDSMRFFMRILFRGDGPAFPAGIGPIREALRPVAQDYGMDWQLRAQSVRPKMLVAVSKGGHCLNDLLHRWSAGTLPADIVGVVSNHDSLRAMSEWHGVPFHHLPVDADNRVQQEAAILDLMAGGGADYLVLARYMQILSPQMAERLRGRAINIHHSFLPGFTGARPYHRAHARGVKLIGATAHFVTADLDEGPIIEQAVERVDHRDSVADMIRIGRDIEASVLARAVHMVGEQRVLIDGNKTVVFR